MLAGLGKDPRHPDLLCDHSGAHLSCFLLFLPANFFTDGLEGSELDLDVDAGREIELHQRVHGLRCRIDNVEQALVGAHLELLAALLVDMRRTVDGELLQPGRQRNGSANLSAGPFRRVDDLTRRRIENPMVERLETYANILAVHCRVSFLVIDLGYGLHSYLWPANSEWRIANRLPYSPFAIRNSPIR